SDVASDEFAAAGLDQQDKVLLRVGRNEAEKPDEFCLKKTAIEHVFATRKNNRFGQIPRRRRGGGHARRHSLLRLGNIGGGRASFSPRQWNDRRGRRRPWLGFFCNDPSRQGK